MARQSGSVFIEGTLDDLTFYKMDGVYYVRMKSSLSRKKVLESPRFVNTRRHASQFAEASKMASVIYRSIPKEERNYKLFRVIVGKAKVLLANGKSKEDIQSLLSSEFIKPAHVEKEAGSEKQIQKSERMFVNNGGRLVVTTFRFSLLPFDFVSVPKLKPFRSLSLGYARVGMTSRGQYYESWHDKLVSLGNINQLG